MGSAFIQLEAVLSSQKDPITPQEENFLGRCYAKAVREFVGSALVSGAVALAATRKLLLIDLPIRTMAQLTFSGGTALSLGLWRFDRSLCSCLGDILALDGTRIQKELANIIMKKYQNDPSMMQLMCRHFYAETVFDDSASELPILRWRYRNFFSDNAVYSEKTHENDSEGDNHIISRSDARSKMADTRSKRGTMNHQGADAIEDPLDRIFGYTMPVEEISHPSGTGTPTEVHTRSHKRSHRRRYQRRHEVSSDVKHAQFRQV